MILYDSCKWMYRMLPFDMARYVIAAGLFIRTARANASAM